MKEQTSSTRTVAFGGFSDAQGMYQTQNPMQSGLPKARSTMPMRLACRWKRSRRLSGESSSSMDSFIKWSQTTSLRRRSEKLKCMQKEKAPRFHQ